METTNVMAAAALTALVALVALIIVTVPDRYIQPKEPFTPERPGMSMSEQVRQICREEIAKAK